MNVTGSVIISSHNSNELKTPLSSIIASVEIDKNELNKNRGLKINIKVNESLVDFFSNFQKISYNSIINKPDWLKKSFLWKKKYPIVLENYRSQSF